MDASSSTGGSTGTGGSSSSTGGSTSTGGTTGTGGTQTTGTGGAKGGTSGTGGSSATGGSTGTGGSSSTGGSTGTGGSTSTGGSTGTGGNPGTGGTPVDQGGMALAKPGATTSTTKAYFNLGDMRLINNRWGSDALNCSSTVQSVFINSDKTIGWSFNRPMCDLKTTRADPDYPEVEFGVAPFGTGSSLLTTPSYSSTTLLPIQISSLNSASVTLDNFSTTFQKPGYWNANFEFWISKQDPTKNADAGVYAEIIVFLGWEPNRQNGTTGAGGWACMVPGSSGPVPGTNFTLCHQSDKWSQSPWWRFFNFVLGTGADSNSVNLYSGKVDIKAILSWVMSNYANPGSGAAGNGTAPFSTSMYLTRIEVGTEIDDNTQGSAKINNLTFEVNGTSKSIQLGN